MNLLKPIFLYSFVVISSFFLSPVFLNAQEVNSNLCVSGDVFQTPASGLFQLDGDEESRARDAMDWIYSMMEPLGSTSNGGEINFDQLYDFDYIGEINGTYSLNVPTDFPVINPSPLVVVNPLDLQDSYRGIVNGVAQGVSSIGTHEVRAYLYTDAEYPQLVTPGSVAADGSWSMDLSSVPVGFSGAWRFRLYEIATDTQIGESWPRVDVLQNLEIGLYSVTDAEYLSFKQEVLPEGVYSFENSFTGTKRVKLINNNGTLTETDDIVLDASTAGTGLVRSYELFPGDVGYGTSFQERTYSYDQALAVSSALSLDENTRAKELVDGLIQLQHVGGTADGAFYFSGPQLSPSSTDPILRTGAHSIALYSLLHYIESSPTDPDISLYINSANRALNYLDTLLVTTGAQEGLYLGGSGRYVADVYEDYVIPWVSTEHNLDTWHVFKKAEKVLGNSLYKTKAENLQSAMLEKLWNSGTNRFYQGHGPTDPDTADALDTSSWGSMMLIGINDIEKAQSSIARIGIYEYTDVETGITGWGPYSDLGGYPGSTPNVWYEGSFGVLMAYARNNLGTLYQSTLDDLKRGQLTSGAFRYATETDSRYEIITAPSVASTAWYILGTVGRDDFWQECSHVSPELKKNSSKGDSSVKFVCSDIEALNYERFGRTNNDLCEYTEGEVVTENFIPESILVSQIPNPSNFPAVDIGTEKLVVSNLEIPIIEDEFLTDQSIQTRFQDTSNLNPIIFEDEIDNKVVAIDNLLIQKEELDSFSGSDAEEPFTYTSEPIVVEEFPSIWIMVLNAIKEFFTNIINLFN